MTEPWLPFAALLIAGLSMVSTVFLATRRNATEETIALRAEVRVLRSEVGTLEVKLEDCERRSNDLLLRMFNMENKLAARLTQEGK